jgi:hypothetical protein
MSRPGPTVHLKCNRIWTVYFLTWQIHNGSITFLHLAFSPVFRILSDFGAKFVPTMMIAAAAGRWPRTASVAVPLSLARCSSSRAAVIIPARLGSTRFPGEGTLARPRRVYLSFSVLLVECAVERGRTLRPVPTMCPQESPSRRSAASLSSSTRCGLPRRSAVSSLCLRGACAPLLQWPERERGERKKREEREERNA